MRNKIEKLINSNIKKITTSHNGKNYDVNILFEVDDLDSFKSIFDLDVFDKKMKFKQAFELKRIDKFLVEFPKLFNIESWTVQKINKPMFTNNKWEEIKIEFIDPIGPSTSQGLFEIVSFLRNNKSNNKALFDINIKSLDPTGVKVEEWIVYVEKVVTIYFGECDYSNNEIQKPYLIVEPLYCVLKY